MGYVTGGDCDVCYFVVFLIFCGVLLLRLLLTEVSSRIEAFFFQIHDRSFRYSLIPMIRMHFLKEIEETITP